MSIPAQDTYLTDSERNEQLEEVRNEDVNNNNMSTTPPDPYVNPVTAAKSVKYIVTADFSCHNPLTRNQKTYRKGEFINVVTKTSGDLYSTDGYELDPSSIAIYVEPTAAAKTAPKWLLPALLVVVAVVVFIIVKRRKK